MNTEIQDHAKYMCNPDVVIREEEESGALLFNPDTNAVKVINPTSLFLWKQFLSPNQVAPTIAALSEAYDEVPEESVEADVKDFMQVMLATGFLGIVEE